MAQPACACGAVGKLVPEVDGAGLEDGSLQLLEWRGGRIGSELLAVERPREGVTACPACQHRPSVFMLKGDARSAARLRR